MGRLILHAGMPKTGSSTIQTWLRANSARLRDLHDIDVLVVRTRDSVGTPRVEIEAHESGSVNSGQFIERYMRPGAPREAMSRELFDGIARRSETGSSAIISGEAFAQPFWRKDAVFLDSLARLSEAHRVTVAYYVRPQHTALEAAWRQWGFRSGSSPSQYLLRRSEQMFYLDTYEFLSSEYPRVDFAIRPFRSDLLFEGDVILDFVAEVLRLEARFPVTAGTWTNRGLPLEIVNALRSAPPGLLWQSPHDNRVLTTIKRLLEELELELPESEDVRLSRALLKRHAWNVFEMDNRKLASSLGWQCDSFIEALDQSDAPGAGAASELTRLDQLWRPKASEAELLLLQHALARLAARSG